MRFSIIAVNQGQFRVFSVRFFWVCLEVDPYILKRFLKLVNKSPAYLLFDIYYRGFYYKFLVIIRMDCWVSFQKFYVGCFVGIGMDCHWAYFQKKCITVGLWTFFFFLDFLLGFLGLQGGSLCILCYLQHVTNFIYFK